MAEVLLKASCIPHCVLSHPIAWLVTETKKLTKQVTVQFLKASHPTILTKHVLLDSYRI